MAFLTLNGISVPCALQAQSQGTPRLIGERATAFSGRTRSTVRGHIRTWSLATPPIPLADARALELALASQYPLVAGGELMGGIETPVIGQLDAIRHRKYADGERAVIEFTLQDAEPYQPILYWLRADRALPAGMTFSRASSATLTDRTGTLQEVGPHTPRLDWSHGRPALRLEPARTNLVAWSSKLSQWTKGGTPTVTDDAIEFGALSLALVRDPTAGALNYVHLPVTFTGDGQKCVSVYLAQGPSPSPTGTDIVIRDNTAQADRLRARVTWSAGAPVVTMIAGTAITAPQHVGQGIYRLQFRSGAVTAANSHTVQIEPARQAETGDVYAGGVQVENAVVPSSLIVTEGAAATRATETVTAPWPHAPQPMTLYVRFVETGGVLLESDSTIVRIGASPGNRVVLFNNTATHTYALRYVSNGSVVTRSLSVAPVRDDIVEFLIPIDEAGAYLAQSINGSDPTQTTLAGLPIPTAWEPPTLTIGGGGQFDLLDFFVLRGAGWTMDQIRRLVA